MFKGIQIPARGGMIHFKDSYASRMRIAQSESVEPGADYHGLPHSSLDSL